MIGGAEQERWWERVHRREYEWLCGGGGVSNQYTYYNNKVNHSKRWGDVQGINELIVVMREGKREDGKIKGNDRGCKLWEWHATQRTMKLTVIWCGFDEDPRLGWTSNNSVTFGISPQFLLASEVLHFKACLHPPTQGFSECFMCHPHLCTTTLLVIIPWWW